MRLEWDAAKNARNIASRGLDFGLAAVLLSGDFISVADARRDYGEVRIRATGVVGDAILVCVYTVRGDARRIISLRYANRKERDAYRAAKIV